MKRDSSMRIAIRVDATVQTGTGHLMRCLSLTTALRMQGATVHFICRPMPEQLAALVQAHGAQLHVLPPADNAAAAEQTPPHASWLGTDWESDAQQTIAALNGSDWDWLIVDHYGIDVQWEQRLRTHVARILVIDDLADRDHDCDMLLDQNLYADQAERYAARVPAGCRQLLGPRYALLRPEFAALRPDVHPRDGEVRRLLVFFGGIDAHNITGVALEALAKPPLRELEVDVIIGAAHPAREAILARCTELGFHCHVQASNMAELMAHADLALGAGGSATWERCSLGLPALALCLADNQRQLLADGARAGLVHAPEIDPADAAAIARELQSLLVNPALRNLLSRTGMAAVDGAGATRVAKALQRVDIELRPATLEDSAALFAWRNHPRIRAASADSRPIAHATHEQWLTATLSNPQRCLLIGEERGQPVGVLRFDLAGERATISIYLVPEQLGSGKGSALLLAAEQWLQDNRPEIKFIEGEVLRDNAPSHRLFIDCGYALTASRYSKRIRA